MVNPRETTAHRHNPEDALNSLVMGSEADDRVSGVAARDGG